MQDPIVQPPNVVRAFRDDIAALEKAHAEVVGWLEVDAHDNGKGPLPYEATSAAYQNGGSHVIIVNWSGDPSSYLEKQLPAPPSRGTTYAIVRVDPNCMESLPLELIPQEGLVPFGKCPATGD